MSRASGRKASIKSSFRKELKQTKFGFVYDVMSDVWKLDESHSIRFDKDVWNKFVYKEGFKRCLARYLETHSVNYAVNIHNFFSSYLKSQDAEEITVKSLASWRESLGARREHQLGAIRGFLYQWEEWEFPGVSSKVASWLEEQTIRGNEKGRSVRTWCPYSGPYSMTELGGILEWATDALRDGVIEYETHAAMYLLATTGQRGVQLRKMRANDLVASVSIKEGESFENFVLQVPQGKERLANSFRGEFIAKPVTRAIYLVAANLREKNQQRLNALLDEPLSEHEAQDLPLFLSWLRIQRFIKKNGSSKRDFWCEHIARPSGFHATVYDFNKLLTYQFQQLCPLVSEETGEPLMLSARRFRYTYGTNCARQGLTGRYLARALGHRDSQNIHCYVETSPEIADRINHLMNGPLTTVAQALAGQLVASESEAVRGDDPRSRVKTDQMTNVGTCGSFGFCPSGWRSCYTCSRFQPWLDGPHQQVLDEILSERLHMMEAGCSDLVIQTSDRLVQAVKKVIELCAAEKTKQSDALRKNT